MKKKKYIKKKSKKKFRKKNKNKILILNLEKLETRKDRRERRE